MIVIGRAPTDALVHAGCSPTLPGVPPTGAFTTARQVADGSR
jgi:hypothetical protein